MCEILHTHLILAGVAQWQSSGFVNRRLEVQFLSPAPVLLNLQPRSLSDIDLSTAANDPQPSASFSARKNPQCIPANTPSVFPGLWPCIWSHLLRLVTKTMSDRLLGVSKGMCPLRGEHARGLAPFAGVGEASFRADPATGGWFNSSRQLHTNLRLTRRLIIGLSVMPPDKYLQEVLLLDL